LKYAWRTRNLCMKMQSKRVRTAAATERRKEIAPETVQV